MRSNLFKGTAWVVLIMLFLAAPIWATTKTTEKPGGEIRADKALLYFVCRNGRGFSTGPIYLMSDDQFLGVVDDDGYNYAYLDPGKHFLWHTSSWNLINEIEFLPGQTYYLSVGRETYALLDEAAGRNLIARVKYFFVTDEKNLQKAAKIQKKHYAKTLKNKKHDDKKRAKIEELPPPLPPANEAGYVKIKAVTPIILVLDQEISSEYSRTGRKVLFKVKADLMIDNHLCVRKNEVVTGIVREARPAAELTPGFIDVIITAVKTVDDQLVPIVGRILRFGKPGSATDFTDFTITNYATDVEMIWGYEVTALTRNDVWVDLKKIPQTTSKK